MKGSSVSWKSSRQPIVTLYFSKSEYREISEAGKDLYWISLIVWAVMQRELDCEDVKITVTNLFTENTSAIEIENIENMADRTKHIDIRYLHIWKTHQDQVINLQ